MAFQFAAIVEGRQGSILRARATGAQRVVHFVVQFCAVTATSVTALCARFARWSSPSLVVTLRNDTRFHDGTLLHPRNLQSCLWVLPLLQQNDAYFPARPRII
jgi:hypothetical protein